MAKTIGALPYSVKNQAFCLTRVKLTISTHQLPRDTLSCGRVVRLRRMKMLELTVFRPEWDCSSGEPVRSGLTPAGSIVVESLEYEHLRQRMIDEGWSLPGVYVSTWDGIDVLDEITVGSGGDWIRYDWVLKPAVNADMDQVGV